MMRKFLEVVAVALLLGALAAAVTGGDHEASVVVLEICFGATFVFLTLGAILRTWRRTSTAGTILLVLGSAALVAFPIYLAATRAVVAFDVWRAKAYLAKHVSPQLEAIRAQTGRYPPAFRLWQHPRPGVPRLVKRFHYASDGRSYMFSVMDPGVCGLVTSYSSITRTWHQTHDPCWY